MDVTLLLIVYRWWVGASDEFIADKLKRACKIVRNETKLADDKKTAKKLLRELCLGNYDQVVNALFQGEVWQKLADDRKLREVSTRLKVI